MQERNGNGRRAADISHDDIIVAVKENTDRLDRLEKTVEGLGFPDDWEEVLRDVAAVGRTGRLVKRGVMWGAPIIPAVAAAWHWVVRTNPFGGGT